MSTRTPPRVTEHAPERGLLDTSVVVGLERLDMRRLPLEAAISALTLAELSAGPPAASSEIDRARRQDRLQRAEAEFEALPFDSACARAYGRLYGEALTVGRRKPRGPRALDQMIAATALAHEMPLFTLNASDLRGMDGLVEIVDLSA